MILFALLALQQRLDDRGEVLERAAARVDLAVDDEGRRALHAVGGALLADFKDAVEQLFVGQAGLGLCRTARRDAIAASRVGIESLAVGEARRFAISEADA